jgi:tRNA-Thr(GGU) m(6)t(6)A37 methyltransferase TsaA
MTHYELKPIGRVESPLTHRDAAPKQGFEGAPRTWLVMHPEFAAGLKDLQAGEALLVFTWLDRADRGVLATRPRDDPNNPMTGVFSTRSPDRPNPIGLHRVRIVSITGGRIEVDDLEALDGTPVVDLKPVLEQSWER